MSSKGAERASCTGASWSERRCWPSDTEQGQVATIWRRGAGAPPCARGAPQFFPLTEASFAVAKDLGEIFSVFQLLLHLSQTQARPIDLHGPGLFGFYFFRKRTLPRAKRCQKEFHNYSFFFLIYIDSLIKLLVSMCVLSPDVMKYKAVVVPFS